MHVVICSVQVLTFNILSFIIVVLAGVLLSRHGPTVLSRLTVFGRRLSLCPARAISVLKSPPLIVAVCPCALKQVVTLRCSSQTTTALRSELNFSQLFLVQYILFSRPHRRSISDSRNYDDPSYLQTMISSCGKKCRPKVEKLTVYVRGKVGKSSRRLLSVYCVDAQPRRHFSLC